MNKTMYKWLAIDFDGIHIVCIGKGTEKFELPYNDDISHDKNVIAGIEFVKVLNKIEEEIYEQQYN